MTIDERLDRLTERHEALTQSVELLVRSTSDNFARVAALMERLTTVVEIHEARLNRLEGGA